LAGDGGPGGYELWREKALTDAFEAKEVEKLEREAAGAGAGAEEVVVEEENEEQWEDEESELTDEEADTIEKSSRKLVDELKESPKASR